FYDSFTGRFFAFHGFLDFNELIKIQKTMKGEKSACKAIIEDLTNHLSTEKALPLKTEALKKFEAAKEYKYPAKTLANEAEYLQALEEVKKLYEESAALLVQATKHLEHPKLKGHKDSLLHDVENIKQILKQQNEQKTAWQNALQAEKDVLRKKIEPLENEVQAYRESGLEHMAYELNNELLQILTLLSKTQYDLTDKKDASIEYKEAFLQEADRKRITETPWSDVKATKALEDMRRALFYANYLPLHPCVMQRSDSLCVTAIDGQRTNGSEYIMHINSAYRFVLQHRSGISDICVKVFEGGTLLHEIALPLPSPITWNSYVLQEGFVHTPENDVLKRYGLDVSFRLNDDEHYKTNLLITQKASTTKYSFTISCDQKCAYSCMYVEPLPFQLDALTKPAVSIAPKSVRVTRKPIAAIPSNQALEACPQLDDFVSQLKADPLALAAYVHNEIANSPFSVYLDNTCYKAEPINRSALMVYLEKCGSPWEQCQLLVYLLKKCGYDAQYVSDALVHLDKSTFENLFFIKIDLFDTIPVQLPGVTFFYNGEWITLYPWMKDREVTEGHTLYQFFPKEYASAEKWIAQYLKNDENILQHIGSGTDDTVGTLFSLFAAGELRKQGLTLDDIGLSYKTTKKQFSSWSDFARPHVVNTPQTLTKPDAFTRGKIEIKSHKNPGNALVYSFALADLNCESLTIECSDQIRVEKNKKSKKKKKTKQTLVTCVKTHFLGKEQNLYLEQSDDIIDIVVTVDYTEAPYTETKQLSKGSRAAVCLHSGTYAPQVTSVFYKKFINEQDEAKRLNALLSYICYAYFEKCAHAEYNLAKLHKVTPSTRLLFGIATLSPAKDKELVIPNVDMTYLEIPSSSSHRFDPSAFTQYAALHIADSSSNEHQILKDVFKDAYAISTVKLLQLAHAKNKRAGLEGDGFLAYTHATFSGEQEPAKTALMHPFSYAYMTPGRVSHLNGSHSELASLIISPTNTYALISSNSITLNGALGTPMSKDYISSSNFKQNFEAYQKRFTQQLQKADIRSQYKPAWNNVADPIDVVTGAFYIDETDIDLPFGLSIRRNYNSQNPQESTLGIGWKLSLNPYLVKQNDTLFAAEADGTVIAYTYNALTSRWEVSLNDNPELANFSGQNPFNAYIVDDVLYSPDGQKRIYKDGLLLKSITANGLELTFSYTNKLVTRIETSNGQYCGFCYNHDDKITEIYAQDGRRVHYSYNTAGELIRVTLPNTAEIHYEYDRFHQIIRETKPHGRVVENIYNTDGKVVEQRSPSGFRQELITTAT
ncbi:MAG: DUF6531 domain-containing protein, partial [Chlamydiales bacterium]|nr:DUF6531 domain-containing protein [Chlamydiales bacterium]